MKLVIASNNPCKVAEIKAILGGFYSDIQSLEEAGLDIDVEEDADTFEGNALKKAREVFKAAQADAVLSDDSGLAVDALGGAPGVYSARYAGKGHDDKANNKKLLEAMAGVPFDRRTCRFVCAVALIRRGGDEIVAFGKAEGVLLPSPRGRSGFGYDPLFFYPPLNKTFAQLTAAEKNSVSHRRRALEALGEKLGAEIK